jgi:hypothetical protein
MRTTAITLFLLLASTTAFAADHPWRVSILAAEISNERAYAWEERDVHAGLGLSVAYAPAESWDVELSAASQTYRAIYTNLQPVYGAPGIPDGSLVPYSEFRRYRVVPLSLSATRRFFAEERVSPYVRAGVRYVDAPEDPVDPFTGPPAMQFQLGFNFDDRTSVEAGAGVRVRLTDRTYLRADVMRLMRADGVAFDPLTRGSAGFTWKF